MEIESIAVKKKIRVRIVWSTGFNTVAIVAKPAIIKPLQSVVRRPSRSSRFCVQIAAGIFADTTRIKLKYLFSSPSIFAELYVKLKNTFVQTIHVMLHSNKRHRNVDDLNMAWIGIVSTSFSTLLLFVADSFAFS